MSRAQRPRSHSFGGWRHYPHITTALLPSLLGYFWRLEKVWGLARLYPPVTIKYTRIPERKLERAWNRGSYRKYLQMLIVSVRSIFCWDSFIILIYPASLWTRQLASRPRLWALLVKRARASFRENVSWTQKWSPFLSPLIFGPHPRVPFLLVRRLCSTPARRWNNKGKQYNRLLLTNEWKRLLVPRPRQLSLGHCRKSSVLYNRPSWWRQLGSWWSCQSHRWVMGIYSRKLEHDRSCPENEDNDQLVSCYYGNISF